ncbi:SDR family NAD(P)-dependent oxidoreductase [Tsukamurella sp. 8F]|uniref:type I polyketide synthase n=1 Tax=unclassified Tsukamurella TaxID=2633480 RepID=UPI0023B97C24|nr:MULTISPECIES: type I polyketide synthase [unclassified Tsukamurella]MDF0532546.1 SDR family NAD(P)-dependent oxidoreductase [Tsukamurella sp. 8J]MDF0586857.1 SDR family NAD(P)-dependent oxidoreductase [Tsukamurella sp. 8F]
MTTDELRAWLVGYIVDRFGADPAVVDPSAPLTDLGVGSKDAVVLSGELGERLGRPVSPVEFWEHPTIDALAAYFTGAATESMTGTPDAPVAAADAPIAIVGLGCRLPGGIDGPDAFWDLLAEGRTAIGEVPPDRWAPWDDGSNEVAAALAGTTRWGGVLDDIAGFDAEHFDIGVREASRMDPQQRLVLEVAHDALEHAGIAPDSLRHTRTGVFIGACLSEYAFLGAADLPAVDAWSNTGGALSIIANRVSYLLDLRGPSLTVDTACSSSLVALHLACQSLRTGESETALVGGVNLLLSPVVFGGFDASGALSPNGECRAFDAAADGFVRGEGCGVVVLKRLADAERDGDRVLAVVRGSAVNQDGRSNGLVAPNPAAQMDVLRAAYAAAGVPPREVDYVEAHGTGTALGDPIEARALGTVLGRGRKADAPLLIGSVKTNVGHLEGAAGVVGLLKAVLAVRRGEIPASLHYSEPNPHIPFDKLRLRVTDGRLPWPSTGRPRRAGISSFGFGGTNAHAVIEQAPVGADAPVPTATPVTTLVVSGSDEARAAAWATRLADWLEGPGADVPLGSVAVELARRAHGVRGAAVVARDAAGSVAGLRALAAGEQRDGVSPVPEIGSAAPVFVFSGQGSQWAGMGRRLLADDPVFAGAVDRLTPVLAAHTGLDLRAVLESGGPLRGDAVVQPAILGLQLAIVESLAARGIWPKAVLGHSVGEVAAAVVAGALREEDGARVIGARARLMSEAGPGAVAVIGAGEDVVRQLIAGHDGVEIAVYTSVRQIAVAGPVDAVDDVLAAAAERNLFARRVDMTVASHTALMQSVVAPLQAELEDLESLPAALPFFSTVNETETPVVDAAYWAANVRQPVRLRQAIEAAAQRFSTFVEIGAQPTLLRAVTDTVPEARTIATLSRDGDDTVALEAAALALGANPSVPDAPRPVVGLPATPWRQTPHWLPAPAAGSIRSGMHVDTADIVDGVPADWRYELTWPERTAPAASATIRSAPATWLVVGDPELADALGGTAMSTDLFAIGGIDAEVAVARADRVVFAPRPVGSSTAEHTARALFDAARAVAVAVAAGGHARLHLVTRNGQPVVDGEPADPAHAALWGLGRTLALENAETWGGLLDVDASVPERVIAGYLRAEADADGSGGEDQVVYRAGRRHVPRLVPASPGPQGEIDTDGAHLVVGATGNLGPAVLRELARLGVGTLVAVSRAPGDRLDALASELAARGTRLVVAAADATDEPAMAALLARFGSELPRLAGVHLAAFGGGPVTLAEMTDGDVTAMFAPKLGAAEILDRLTRRIDLSHFTVFTSISGLTGSRWLAHYAATTTFLDALVSARRAAGLPGSAVNWGLWASLDARQGELERQATAGSGLVPMDDDTAIRALGPALARGGRSVVVAADWPRMAAAYRIHAALRLVDELATDAPDEAVTAFRQELAAADPERRYEMLENRVAAAVAGALGVSPELVDRRSGFFQAGMDSLTVVTAARALARDVGDVLPTSAVFDYPTVVALAGHLASVLPEFAGDAAEPDDDYDDLSEDELLAQLSERLS